MRLLGRMQYEDRHEGMEELRRIARELACSRPELLRALVQVAQSLPHDRHQRILQKPQV